MRTQNCGKPHMRLLALLLVLIMLLSSVNSGMLVAFAAPNEQSWAVGPNVTATLDAAGLLHLTGAGDTHDYADAEGQRAPFYENRADIFSVVIDEGVTSVGAYYFITAKISPAPSRCPPPQWQSAGMLFPAAAPKPHRRLPSYTAHFAKPKSPSAALRPPTGSRNPRRNPPWKAPLPPRPK